MASGHVWLHGSGLFHFLSAGIGTQLKTDTIEFWFMMQIAMIFGFITSYPVSWRLIRSGIKEKM